MHRSTRHVVFDPEAGVPLEAWLAHRKAEGWVPVTGGIAVVNTSSGAVLAFQMRRLRAKERGTTLYTRGTPDWTVKAEGEVPHA